MKQFRVCITTTSSELAIALTELASEDGAEIELRSVNGEDDAPKQRRIQFPRNTRIRVGRAAPKPGMETDILDYIVDQQLTGTEKQDIVASFAEAKDVSKASASGAMTNMLRSGALRVVRR